MGDLIDDEIEERTIILGVIVDVEDIDRVVRGEVERDEHGVTVDEAGADSCAGAS